MDVILHVGAHRTATTAFQRHLAAYRDTLHVYKTTFWGPKVIRGGLFGGMSGGAGPILPWQANRAGKRAALRIKGLRQDGMERLILSDENMLGNLRDVLEDTLLYPDAANRIAGFAKGFQGHNLTIGLGIRCYSTWWSSALAFRLSRGGPLPRTELRERMVTQPRRWRHLAEQIARAVPDARVAVWSHEAMGSAPHRILHDLTEIATRPSSLPILNAAPRAKALRDLLCNYGVDPDTFIRSSTDRFMPFEAYEADALRGQYQDDLTWLANGAGGLVDYIDAPLAETGAQTVEGRGLPDDGEHRSLA